MTRLEVLKAMHEIRWHGRAGQGVITASRMLASAAILEGKYAQAFPEFGAERLGAPVNGFTRVADGPINVHSQIYNPEAVVVLDPSLMKTVNVAEGLVDSGCMIVNTREGKDAVRELLGLKGVNIHVVDASTIALDVFKRPIYNTPMLGALLGVLPIVSMETVEKVTFERFPGTLGERNMEAIKRAWKEVQER